MTDPTPKPKIVLELEQEPQDKLQRPNMYRVLLHNDPYTPREFVVFVLQTVFRKTDSSAKKIMLEAHTKGIAVVAIYTYDIASTSIAYVQQLAEEFEYPLLCTMEEIET